MVSMKGMKMVAQRSMEQIDDDFHLSDIMFFTKSGLEVKKKNSANVILIMMDSVAVINLASHPLKIFFNEQCLYGTFLHTLYLFKLYYQIFLAGLHNQKYDNKLAPY